MSRYASLQIAIQAANIYGRSRTDSKYMFLNFELIEILKNCFIHLNIVKAAEYSRK